jgi:hypothetical protein
MIKYRVVKGFFEFFNSHGLQPVEMISESSALAETKNMGRSPVLVLLFLLRVKTRGYSLITFNNLI